MNAASNRRHCQKFPNIAFERDWPVNILFPDAGDKAVRAGYVN